MTTRDTFVDYYHFLVYESYSQVGCLGDKEKYSFPSGAHRRAFEVHCIPDGMSGLRKRPDATGIELDRVCAEITRRLNNAEFSQLYNQVVLQNCG
jgi:hypothetical protein